MAEAAGGLSVKVVDVATTGPRPMRVREVTGGLPVAVVDGLTGPSGVPVVVVTDDGSPGPAPMPVAAVSGSFYPQPAVPPVAGYDLWLPSDGGKWKDAARTTRAVADGAPIGAWDDYSAGANHAVQATAAARPLLKTPILNGQPVTRFDGVDDYLAATCTAQAAQTLFIVVTEISGADKTFFSYTTVGAVATLYANSTGAVFYFSPNMSKGGDIRSATIVAAAYASAASVKVRVGGGATAALDPNNLYATAVQYNLGADPGPAAFGNYDIAEVVRYPSALSLANHDLVGNYLAAKFGLTWTAAA